MNSVYELTDGLSGKSIISCLTDHLNFNHMPPKSVTSSEKLLAGAWMMTGRHLRKSLDTYGKTCQEEDSQEKSQPKS